MAGTYVEGVSKVLSGVYTLIKAAVSGIFRGARGVVAYPFTSDWGPVNTLVAVSLAADFKNTFNADKTALTAAKIYTHAFKGKPSKVLGYRMATGTAAQGTVILNDDAAGMSLTIKTRYPSAREFVAAVKAGVGGTTIVEITEGGVLLVKAESDAVAGLEEALNASDYVTVTAKGANVPDVTAGAPFAGGHNGATVITVDHYDAFLAEVEADGTANAVAFDGVTDETKLTNAETWVRRVRTEGVYVTFVRGGAAGWDTAIADAIAKSKAINYRGIVNVGNGCDGYTAADMAIFVAARVASVPLNRTLTDELVPYLAVNKKLKPSQREAAKEGGTVVFVHDIGGVVIDEGVNTLTVPLADEVREFGKIRVNNTVDTVARDLEAFGNEYKVTRSNTAEARETFAATVETDYLAPLAAQEILQPGYFYRPDPEYHGKEAIHTPKIDEAFFHADLTPVDSMERVYQKIGMTF